MQAYGNHPSFCMLAVGNEPSGRGRDAFLSKIVAYWKQKDRRRVYTGTSGWPVTHESDYHSRPQPRGHAWGAGLRSRFNAGRLSTDFDYSDEVSRFSVPIVSHEIGQWCVYPSFREIDKYTGVLKALNFEIFRDSLAEHRMADQAQDFLMASGRLQALLYKEEIEAALRTPGFGGFQLLDIHDFPGQGTALVGVLDPFWDSKGYIEPREYHEFCCEVVPLVRIKKLTWTTDETLRAGVEVANFGPAPIERAVPAWSLNYADGREFASGRLPRRNIEMGNGIESGDITVLLTDVAAPAKLILTVSLTGTPYTNHWDIWVYPAETVVEPPEDIIIADKLDEQVRSALSTGGKVLLMPALQSIDSDIPAGFTTIFWNTQWTNRQPPHTLGILCDPKHPALAKFPTDFHSNWQWWDLVTKSGFMILDRFDPGLRPIVQVIDDWNSNRRLALIFEAEVGGGKLLFCSIDLRSDLGRRPVARQMLHSLLAYMDSDAFSPAETVETELIESLFREPSLLGSSAVINADSEAPGYPGVNAIDGRTDTIWHTPWGEGAAGYPHELSIELQKEVEIQALEYLPRQDMSNGWIREYEVYVSEDGGNWADAVAKGAFAGNRDRKRVVFAEPKRGRFIRFVALSGFDRQIFASVAEIEIVTEPRK